ncbi:MAG: FRG domain-containing protein [Bacteroidales bacterium]|nr:FRG domain-containing protein [Bacteroidales bacterium]
MNNWISIEEKQNFYSNNYKRYDNESELKEMLSFLDNNREKYIYRGLSSWKFKCYNSIQRFYNTKNNDMDIEILGDILLQMTQSWNCKQITNYLTSLGVANDNSFAYLSLMQHYGVPTPLIDFSYDLDVALYFATSDQECLSKKESDYFSIYLIPKSSPIFGFESLINFGKSMLNDQFTVNGYAPYNLLRGKKTILAIENDIGATSFLTKNNCNIENQKGLFVINNYLHLSLEEGLSKFSEELGYKRNNNNNYRGMIDCYDINKNLIPIILERLQKKSINNSTLFSTTNTSNNLKIENFDTLWRDIEAELSQKEIKPDIPNLHEPQLIQGSDYMSLFAQIFSLSETIENSKIEGAVNENKVLERAILFLKMHEIEEAFNDIEYLITNSNSIEILSRLSFRLINVPNMEEHIKRILKKALKDIENNADCDANVHYYTGASLLYVGEIENSVIQCNKCLAKQPNNTAGLNLKVQLLVENHHFSQALETCEMALKLDPYSKQLLHNQAICRNLVTIKQNGPPHYFSKTVKIICRKIIHSIRCKFKNIL